MAWPRATDYSAAVQNPPACFADAELADTDGYGALFRGLLERGIYIAPSQFECLFVSLAHTDEDVDRTVEAVADVVGG